MRTQLNRWQIRELVETETGNMKFVELKLVTPAHVPNDIVTYTIPFPDGTDGVQINTIKVISDEANTFTVDLMDGNTTQSIYASNEELQFHYDQVIIAYKPSERAAFVKIHNKGSKTTKFTITIRGVEVS